MRASAGTETGRWRPSQDGPSAGQGVPAPENGHEAFIEISEALARLESLVERTVQEHPENRAAVRAAIRKVRVDLLHLENLLAAAEHSNRKTAR